MLSITTQGSNRSLFHYLICWWYQPLSNSLVFKSNRLLHLHRCQPWKQNIKGYISTGNVSWKTHKWRSFMAYWNIILCQKRMKLLWFIVILSPMSICIYGFCLPFRGRNSKLPLKYYIILQPIVLSLSVYCVLKDFRLGFLINLFNIKIDKPKIYLLSWFS